MNEQEEEWMKNSPKTWIPNSNQKALAERFIWPFVQLARFLTSWKAVLVWAFALTYFTGQTLLFSVVFAVVFAYLGYYVWRDPREEEKNEN